MKTEGEEGGADVGGDLLDDVDVASPVQIDTGGVDVFRIAVPILISECRSLDGGTSDPTSDLCSRQHTNQPLTD